MFFRVIMNKKFYLLPEQVEALNNAGLNVEACGSCTYTIDHYDGISYIEKRSMLLQDMLEVLSESELVPTLSRSGRMWTCTLSFGDVDMFKGTTSLDAVFEVMKDALKRGLIANKFLNNK